MPKTESNGTALYKTLMLKIESAKKSVIPRDQLFQAYGRCQMAYELGAITHDEFMILNHEAVADGINNPKYFTR